MIEYTPPAVVESPGEYPCRWEDPVVPPGTDKDAWDSARALRLVAETAEIETRQKVWHETNLWNATLFCNRELPGFHWGLDPQDADLFPANLITENLVLSIGEALLSKASSSPIKPTLVPRGSSFKTRRLVRRLDHWVYGTWRQLRMEEKCVAAFLDAYISGKGPIVFDHDGDGLRAESVFFDDLIVDNTEAAHRAAPCKYRIRYMVPRNVVERVYGVTLDDQAVARGYGVEYRGVGPGWVPVVRAWYCGDDGRHVLACCGKLLKDEPWDEPTPGLEVFDWQVLLSGYYGASGVETVVPYQITQNELNEVIRDVQALQRPHLLAHAGSKFDAAQIDNTVGSVWWYTGVEPKPLDWRTNIADLYSERERNKQQCYGDFGISQMEAQAEMPANFRYDSSAAVREAGIQSDRRFLRLWTAFEQFRLACARRLILTMSRDPDAEHRTIWYVGGKAHAEEILWSQVKDLSEDHYTWSLEAVPATAATAAARRDAIEGRMMTGRLDPEYDKDIVRTPDLEAIEAAETAACDNIDWVIEEMEDGRYTPPDPFQNLAYGIPRVTANLLTLQTLKDVPEKIMTFHRRWVRAALAIVNPQPAPQPGTPDPAMMDPALGGAMGSPALGPAGPGGNPALQTPTPPGVAYPAAPPPAMAPIG